MNYGKRHNNQLLKGKKRESANDSKSTHKKFNMKKKSIKRDY